MAIHVVTLRGFMRSSTTLAVGSSVAAALFWTLINVPESNVFTLSLSALLVPLFLVTIGITTAMAAALAQGVAFRAAGRRAVAALPGFVAGLAIFALLWWLTGSVDEWWRDHRGEMDAWLLRQFGATRTAFLHVTVFWMTWLVRWALGLSVILGLVTAGTLSGWRASGRGLRLAVRLLPFAATAVGVVVVNESVWRLASWRPTFLPPNWVEPAFAVTKIVVLYTVAVAMAAAILGVFGRAATKNSGTKIESL